MSTKKYLGQHFLQNKGKLLKMVNVIDPDISRVIEIGSGQGTLTRQLLDSGFFVIAVEKDKDLIPVLMEKFNSEIKSGRLKVVQDDILKFLLECDGAAHNHLTRSPSVRSRPLSQIFPALMNARDSLSIELNFAGGKYAVTGNIPYYITGYLLRTIGELKNKPTQTILLIQEEVAKRMCAKAGDMNLLAASIGWWAGARIITHVPRQMFSPPPKVDSAVVELKTKFTTPGVVNLESVYFACIHAVFKQPRRTMVKNLVDAGVVRAEAEKALEKIGLPMTVRPQELTIPQLYTLSTILNFKS